jgi:inorganic pyrophosphatase/exopolyphosphatase
MNETRNFVMSYSNPDTDGVACSIALAKLLTLVEGKKYHPIIQGSLSAETEYVLDWIGLKKPESRSLTGDISSIALVDTHHKAQLPEDFPFDKVRLIVDHHPNGDDELFFNAKIDNRKIGAAASIIAEMYLLQDNHDQEMLSLLGLAIVSNTLNFIAPSSSDYDMKIYKQIDALYPFTEDIISGMFMQRSSVLQKSLEAALLSDFKTFETKRGIVGIAQMEVYDLMTKINIEEARDTLIRIAHKKGLCYCLFNGVDIKERKSIVVCANAEAEQLADKIFNVPFEKGYSVFDRILLRKTDFIPSLNR